MEYWLVRECVFPCVGEGVIYVYVVSFHIALFSVLQQTHSSCRGFYMSDYSFFIECF